MKSIVIIISITFVTGLLSTTPQSYSQITPEQQAMIRETCFLESIVDPTYTLNESSKLSESEQTEDQKYEKECIEIMMIKSYKNNESHDERINKVTDLFIKHFF